MPKPITKEEISRSEDLRTLFNYPEWKTFAALIGALTEKFKSNLLNFDNGFSIEQIAIERVKWTSYIAGMQAILIEMNAEIDALNKLEKEKKDARKEQ